MSSHFASVHHKCMLNLHYWFYSASFTFLSIFFLIWGTEHWVNLSQVQYQVSLATSNESGCQRVIFSPTIWWISFQPLKDFTLGLINLGDFFVLMYIYTKAILVTFVINSFCPFPNIKGVNLQICEKYAQ